MRKPESELMSVGHIEINATEFTAEVHSDDLPILATRNLVLFPGVTYPINIVRKLSRDMAEEAERLKLAVGIVCQNDPEIDNPALSDLCSYGVVAQVLKVLTLPVLNSMSGHSPCPREDPYRRSGGGGCDAWSSERHSHGSA